MSRTATGWLFALLVAGVGLLVTAAFTASGGAGAVKRGGTLRLVYIQDPGTDPQNGGSVILRATQLPLYALPDAEGDRRILPAAAAGLPRISKDGRTYTFTVRRGFRFSDGRPVAARNFAVAFNRLFNPGLASIWTYLFEDVVGARAVREGKASTVSGVRVRGDKLIVRLEQPRPDLLARLTNPTISATPLDMPMTLWREPAPSAGPYVLSEHVVGQRAVFVRNRFWRRDLLPWRPANVDRIVFERPGLSQVEALEAVERNEIDFALAQGTTGVPELRRKYGINKRRLFVRPRLTVHSLLFNNDGPLFRSNPKLRQAINHALDRPDMVRQIGPLAGRRTDQILPPSLPGYRDWELYSLKSPNLRRARALARGNLRGGRAVFYSRDAASPEPFQPRVAEVVKFNLARIGLAVEVKTFPDVRRRLRAPGEPWDIAIFGWFADYPDPFNVINELFDAQNIPRGDPPIGWNLGRFDDPVFNRRMRRAARLSGAERLEAYARLERDLLREAAPIAPFFVVNDVMLVSTSLGCFSYGPMEFLNLVAVCKK